MDGAGNIVLVGYRGSGKTSVGRALAELTGRPVLDTDDEIVRRAEGRTIAEIFSREGETGFRRRERTVVSDAAARGGWIVSCGGGVVLRTDNVAALRGSGRVYWLSCGPEELHRRINADPLTGATRPALTNLAGEAEVRRLLEVRTPLYQAAAHVEIDVGNRTVRQAAEAILEDFRRAASAGEPGTRIEIIRPAEPPPPGMPPPTVVGRGPKVSPIQPWTDMNPVPNGT